MDVDSMRDGMRKSNVVFHLAGWYKIGARDQSQDHQGQRDEENGLDEEDTVIIRSILQGLQNPASLPDPNQGADATMAAPGLAHMIHAASRGDAQALQAAAYMAEQMINTQGDMRLLGGQIKRLLDGERDPDVLCKGMGPSGQQLVLSMLEELNKLAEQ